MSREKDLIKNTGILFIAKASTQIVSFLLLPLYTSILSTAEYGEIDIYSTLSMILIPLFTLQLEQAGFRFLITAKSKNEEEEIITSAVCMIVLSFSFFSLAYVILNLIHPIRYGAHLYFYYLSMTLITILQQICRGFGKNGVYGFSSFLTTAIALFLNVIFVAVMRLGVFGVILATIIGNLITTLYIIIRIHIWQYLKSSQIHKSRIREMLNYSVPLIFNQISSWVINYSDRIIVLQFLGIGMNGIYSLACKFSNLLNTFFGVYNIAWTENVVRCIEDKDHKTYMCKIVTLTFQIYLCIVTGIINILPLIFKFFVNSNYNAAYQHIPILLLGMFFSGMAATLGSIYVAHKYTKEVGISTTMAGIVNIVVHLSLIYFIKLYAASISTLISFAALFFFRYFDMQKFEPIHLKFKQLSIPITIFIISWIAYGVKCTPLIILGLMLNIAFLVLFLHTKQKDLLKLIKQKKIN